MTTTEKKKKRVLSNLLRARGIRDNKLITKCLTNTPRHDARLKNTPRQEITCDQTKKNRTFQRLVKVSRERFVRYIFHRTGIQFLRVFKSHSFSQKGAHLKAQYALLTHNPALRSTDLILRNIGYLC